MTRAALIEQAVRDVHSSPAWRDGPLADFLHGDPPGSPFNGERGFFFHLVRSRFAQLVGGTKNYDANGRVIDEVPL